MNKEIDKNIIGGQNGSTLVELLVALSIFAIFITVAVGGFIQSLANQRIVLKLNAATDNLSLSLEQMMREMRVGTNFLTGSNGQVIQFDHYNDQGNPETIQYALDTSNNAIVRTVTTQGVPSTDVFTADNVDVSYFKTDAFLQNIPGPCRIGITLGVTASDRGISITNYIQTTISSRIFTSTCQ